MTAREFDGGSDLFALVAQLPARGQKEKRNDDNLFINNIKFDDKLINWEA